MNIMAKNSVNKSALVRDFLAKYPDKGPAAIAKQIGEEQGVKITGKLVTSIKTKLKQTPGSAAPAAAATPATATPTKKNAAPARGKPTPAKPASASAAALSQHIANLKAAAQRLGKDEAKRIMAGESQG
jgi:hypothetical protein